MAEKNKAYWEVIGGNNDIGIGCNSHLFVNDDGKNNTNVLVDIGMKMGGEFSEIPDVREELKNADALVFTHCHADHIQGLIDFVKMGYDFTKEVRDEKTGEFVKKPVPLIGSAFTVSYIKAELARARIPGNVLENIVTVAHDARNHEIAIPESIQDRLSYTYETGNDGKERLKLSIGSEGSKINVSLFDMDHSAKGSTAVGLEMQTESGMKRVLHFGDWKKEDAEHSIIDYEGLKGFVNKGVDVVLTDSTSTVKPTTLNHEIDVRNDITDKLTDAIPSVAAKLPEGQRLDIVHSSIARSGNRIFDCDVIGTAEALRKLGRIKSGDTIDVYMHGGADFTRKVMEKAAEMSDSKQYNILNEYTKQTGIQFAFHSGKDVQKKGIVSAHDTIHVTTGTQADEQAQLKKLSMTETAERSTLPRGENAIYVQTQTPIPSGNNPQNVAIMNKDLEPLFAAFLTCCHSSGHGSKQDSDEMMAFVKENNPRKATVCPVHGAFSQNHLEATAHGLADKGINTEIVRNGNRCYFEEDGIRFEKTKEKGSILVVDGAISYMNSKNPYGNDVNDARKRGTVDDYLRWDQKRMFGGKSYVRQEADGSLTTVKDCGGMYKEGEKVDRMSLKRMPPKNERSEDRKWTDEKTYTQSYDGGRKGGKGGKKKQQYYSGYHGGRGGR